MTDLILVTQGGFVPPSFITCPLCGRGRVARIGGTVNGTHRHHAAGTMVSRWCYGPERTEKRRLLLERAALCVMTGGRSEDDGPMIAFSHTEVDMRPHMLGWHTDPDAVSQAHTASLTQEQLAAAHHQDHSWSEWPGTPGLRHTH